MRASLSGTRDGGRVGCHQGRLGEPCRLHASRGALRRIAGWIPWAACSVIPLLMPLGCATTETAENEVWVQIIPGRRYTFENVQGRIRDDRLVVSGTLRSIGHSEPQFQSIIVEGRDKNNKVVVREQAGVRMQSRAERFTVRVPYQPDLDWTVQSYESGGLMSVIKKTW